MTGHPFARWSPTARRSAATVVVLAVMLALAAVDGTSGTAVFVLAVLSWLPLLGRHRFPEVALVAAAGVDAVRLAVVELQPPTPFTVLPIATLVAVSTLAALRGRVLAWTAGLSTAAVLFTAGYLGQPAGHSAELMFMVDLVVAATAAGVLARRRRLHLAVVEQRAESAERMKDEEARRQVAEERVRIARELHDVLAHHLTLVNAQAGVAEYLLQTDPHAAAEALHGTTRHSRQALDEVRVTVGLLRQAVGPDDASDDALRPMPTLADVDELVAFFREAGGSVAVTRTGEAAPLSAAADLAAYRIVQESLTNARRHAASAAVRLDLCWTATRLMIEVVNGAPSRAPSAPGTGHGLIGMRERALSPSGDLTSAVTPDGGFAVSAWLPVDPAVVGATP